MKKEERKLFKNNKGMGTVEMILIIVEIFILWNKAYCVTCVKNLDKKEYNTHYILKYVLCKKSKRYVKYNNGTNLYFMFLYKKS